MRKVAKGLSSIIATVMIAGTFAGCGALNSKTASRSLQMPQTAPPASGKGSVEFLLTYPKEKTVLYQSLDEFQTKTGIKLKIQYMPLQDAQKQINIMVAGNNLPDVLDIDAMNTASYVAMGILADITDRVKAEIQVDKYYEAPMKFSQYNGKYFALPFTTNDLALFYNKDMFKDEGIAAPPKTWDELFSASEKLSKPGVFGLAMAGNKSFDTTFHFCPIMWQAGSNFDKLDSPETVKALNFYKTLIDKKQMSVEMANWSSSDSANQFIAGKAAMLIDGPWRLGNVNSGAKFNWDVAMLPEGPAGKFTCLGGHNVVVVKKDKIDNAWALVKYLNDPDVMLKFSKAENYIPARKDITDGDKHFQEGPMKVFADMEQFARARGPLVKFPKLDMVLQEMVQSVVLGQKTPEQAARDAGAAVVPFLK